MGDPTKNENGTKTNVEGVVDEDIEISENDVEEVIEDDGEFHSGEILSVVVVDIPCSS